MADKCDLCLLGLIFLSSLLTGSSGVNDAHVFISSGENVHLSCNNALHDCKSTTWNYNRFSHSVTVELIAGGIKKKDTERLSLGSDCSLNIKNITEEDYGSYICQQWTGVIGQQKQHGTDARVFLHALHAQDKTTTSVIPVHITNSQDPSTTNTHKTKAQADSRTSVTAVHITKSTTPRPITSTQAPDSTTLIPVSSSNSETTSRRSTAAAPTQGIFSLPVIVVVIVVSASIALLILALIIWLIRKKRAGVRRATDDSVEQTDDVTYTEVTVHSKNRAKKNKVRCDDKVTYASIRGSKAGDQEN